MQSRPIITEMRDRLAECARSYGGAIDRDASLVWDGYFAALIEWGLISPSEHAELTELLPKQRYSPVMGVFLGWTPEATEEGSTSKIHPTDTVVLGVTAHEAVVLDELLRRFSMTEKLELEHPAEQQALWNLECVMEKHGARPSWPTLEDSRAALSPQEE